MANIVPGVVWQPVDVGSRAKRRKGRGLCGHVAVSSSKNLVPGPLASRAADWHFYLPKSGPAIQYIDLDLQCWATGAGNSTMAAFESEGGLGSTAQVNAEPWTENQLDWAARILRHMHDTEGVPLRVMASSASSESGFGTHRLGVPGYMAAGGEKWSSSAGKLCPGDAKHAQRFEIVRRAAGAATQEDDLSAQFEADMRAWAADVNGELAEHRFLLAAVLGVREGRDETEKRNFGEVRPRQGKALDYTKHPERTTDDEFGHVLGIRRELAAARAEIAALKGVQGGASAGSVYDDVVRALKENIVKVDVDVSGNDAA